jgi:hypothetical protein
MSTCQQNWRKEQSRFCLEARGWGVEGEGRGQGGEMAQTMYSHVSKCMKKKNPKNTLGKSNFSMLTGS